MIKNIDKLYKKPKWVPAIRKGTKFVVVADIYIRSEYVPKSWSDRPAYKEGLQRMLLSRKDLKVVNFEKSFNSWSWIWLSQTTNFKSYEKEQLATALKTGEVLYGGKKYKQKVQFDPMEECFYDLLEYGIIAFKSKWKHNRYVKNKPADSKGLYKHVEDTKKEIETVRKKLKNKL